MKSKSFLFLKTEFAIFQFQAPGNSGWDSAVLSLAQLKCFCHVGTADCASVADFLAALHIPRIFLRLSPSRDRTKVHPVRLGIWGLGGITVWFKKLLPGQFLYKNNLLFGQAY